jgi:predicted alpha/beta hydrolase family esterase
MKLMVKRAFIIHGWGGYPEEGWFPWLKKNLESRGFKVEVPAMPDPEDPDLDRWTTYLKNLIGKADKNLALIGHSMGCRTILCYLESLPSNQEVGQVVCVAGWVKLRKDAKLTPEEKRIARQWTDIPTDWTKIKSRAEKFTAIFSDNDDWVDLSNSQVYKEKLGAKIVIEHNKGHFSGNDGVTELPSVLKAIF